MASIWIHMACLPLPFKSCLISFDKNLCLLAFSTRYPDWSQRVKVIYSLSSNRCTWTVGEIQPGGFTPAGDKRRFHCFVGVKQRRNFTSEWAGDAGDAANQPQRGQPGPECLLCPSEAREEPIGGKVPPPQTNQSTKLSPNQSERNPISLPLYQATKFAPGAAPGRRLAVGAAAAEAPGGGQCGRGCADVAGEGVPRTFHRTISECAPECQLNQARGFVKHQLTVVKAASLSLRRLRPPQPPQT